MNRIIPKAFKHKIRSFSNQNPYSTNLYKSTTNFQGNDLAEKRYFDLRRLKENHDSIVRPNHRRIIIIGAGVAGVAIMNQIPRLTGWAWQHVTMIEDQTFHYHPLGKELLSYNLMDISEIE